MYNGKEGVTSSSGGIKGREELQQIKQQLDELFMNWNESNNIQLKFYKKINKKIEKEDLTEGEKDDILRYKLEIAERCNEKSWLSEALNDKIQLSMGFENQNIETSRKSRSPRTTSTTKDDMVEGSSKRRRYIW